MLREGQERLRGGQARLQELWVRNPRNRIIIMVITGVVTILLLCGACNLLGTISSGVLTSLFSSNPGLKPNTSNGSPVSNANPTFPIPTPQTYPFPNQGSTPVGSSGTPPPSPTRDHNESPTVRPGGGQIHYQFSPAPNGRDLVAGQTNQIILNGPPGTAVSVSIYLPGDNSCLNLPVMLDGAGNGFASCAIPANLKNTNVNFSLLAPSIGYTKAFMVQII